MDSEREVLAIKNENRNVGILLLSLAIIFIVVMLLTVWYFTWGPGKRSQQMQKLRDLLWRRKYRNSKNMYRSPTHSTSGHKTPTHKTPTHKTPSKSTVRHKVTPYKRYN